MIITGKGLFEIPSRDARREMTYASIALAAIDAWDRGEQLEALAWIGRDADEYDAIGDTVYLRAWRYPTGGNSPRGYRHSTRLGVCPASAALERHILLAAGGQ